MCEDITHLSTKGYLGGTSLNNNKTNKGNKSELTVTRYEIFSSVVDEFEPSFLVAS